ncbi:hypothetical protein EUX98_g2952 [Antrodiella citrinella]|uniref:Fungal-type protein kinase domain-containing protein n=1 Tax=Antrodiella citrinella TaxID=2447956 RepID=A0A4V3XJ10_9APHY|nr:hypothetical protein EUX98_g2952 [Antrodiella citrinella]
MNPFESNLVSLDEDRETDNFSKGDTTTHIIQHHANTLEDDAMNDNRSRKPVTPPRHPASAVAGPSPIKGSLDSAPRTSKGTDNDAINEYLDTLLADKIIHNIPVVDFIHAVYGMKKEDLLHTLPQHGYVLPSNFCALYSAGKYNKGSSERTAYKPLLNIIHSLVAQLKECMDGRMAPGNSAEWVNMKDREVAGHFTKLKPDFLRTWLAAAEQQKWTTSASSGELKKDAAVQKAKIEINIDLKKLPKRNKMSTSTSSAPTATPDETIVTLPLPSAPSRSVSANAKQGTKRKKGVDSPDADASTIPRTAKRLRSGGNGALSSTSSKANPDRRSAIREKLLTHKELQAVKYVHELGSHGIRSYATGILIDDFKVTIFYMDRIGVIKATPFDFLDEPHFFLLYLAAVQYATPSQLGFFPMLKFPSPSLTSEVLETYQSVILDLSGAQGCGEIMLNDLRFLLDVSADRRVVPTHGAVGRATIVLPLLPVSDSKDSVMLCGTEKTVAKISWQPRTRDSEDSNIRAIRTTLAKTPKTHKYLKHIVDLKCSLTRTMAEMGLPRAFMDLKDTQPERVCRLLIMTEYLPLNMVDSVMEFKSIFIDVMFTMSSGHRAVYVSAQILHRDISINNLMFHRTSSAGAVGVLCDWDLARVNCLEGASMTDIIEDFISAHVDRDTSTTKPATTTIQQPADATVHHPPNAVKSTDHELPAQAPRYRTGTGPFIALDLLKFTRVPMHLYRHDLESFFWVLVWFVAGFVPDTHTVRLVGAWLHNDLRLIGLKKTEFLRNAGNILSDVHADYQSLVRDWVKPLIMILMAKLQRTELEITDDMRLACHFASAETEADQIKVSKEAVSESIAAREGILTYESFMRCLKVDLDSEGSDSISVQV